MLTREHNVQVLVIVVPLFFTVIAMVSGATWYLSSDISAKYESAVNANAIITARISADEARINAMEKLDAEHYTADLNARNSFQIGLTTLIQNMADLRVDFAKGGLGHK